MGVMTFTIPIPPVTKKNSQQIFKNHKTGKNFIAPSKRYIQYEKDCLMLITGQYRKGIDYPVNVKAIYYIPDNRRVDISNLHSALHDVLVKAGVVKDDNCKIIASTDGSRVMVDRDNPRTEIEITEVEE